MMTMPRQARHRLLAPRALCAGQMRLAGLSRRPWPAGDGRADAVDAGIKTAIIGVAPVGGQIPDHWLPQLIELARAGIDIASGMHSKLKSMPDLVAAAYKGGSNLTDVRVPPAIFRSARAGRAAGNACS